jgi:hypothetical protein
MTCYEKKYLINNSEKSKIMLIEFIIDTIFIIHQPQ